MFECRVGRDPTKELKDRAEELAATEVLYTDEDGKTWLRHDCGTCSHGLILGYAVRHGYHPYQRLVSHKGLEDLRCDDTHVTELEKV